MCVEIRKMRISVVLFVLIGWLSFTQASLADESAQEAAAAIEQSQPAGAEQAVEAAGVADVDGDQSQAAEPVEDSGVFSNDGPVNKLFGQLVGLVAPLLFSPVPVIQLPVILTVLVVGAFFFSFYFKFINFCLFKHSIDVIRGKFDRPGDKGEITHFQALSSALSATVGLGNIAGVAVAIAAGGPGAVFWMWLMAIFGMSMKFTSCTFAQIYRRIGADGRVLGGPMVYLEEGFKEKFGAGTVMAMFGKALAVLFAICVIGGSLGGGNLFQANQSYTLIAQQVSWAEEYPLAVGLLLAALVGVVIIGGIKRIGEVTSKMVPTMCVFYCIVCLTVVLANIGKVPELLGSIVVMAFTDNAMFGGFLGVLLQGVKRAAFSNEAGLGSAAIAHAAAKTDEPVREGVVAMIGPFIDTILVCTMTALTILITEAHLAEGVQGVEMTAHAFAQVHSALPVFLTIAAVIFAYSTAVAWSYYGERAVEYLFGLDNKLPLMAYKVVFVCVIAVAPLVSVQNVIDFSDCMILSLAFPNILGLMFLVSRAKPLVVDYVNRLKNGEMQPYK